MTQLKHLFNFARSDEKKVIKDSVNVGAHGCTSLLTNSRKNGVLEDPVKPLLVKSIGHLTLCVVRRSPEWQLLTDLTLKGLQPNWLAVDGHVETMDQ